MTKLLFICSRNQWRGPTAENIFKKNPKFQTKSAGVKKSSRHLVSAKDIDWADIIFAMEKEHKNILYDRFKDLLLDKSVYVLNIPDDYKYNDPDLIELIELLVKDILTQFDEKTVSGEQEVAFDCPYCGEEIVMVAEIYYGGQEFIEDCQVCCSPIQLKFSANDENILLVTAQRS